MSLSKLNSSFVLAIAGFIVLFYAVHLQADAPKSSAGAPAQAMPVQVHTLKSEEVAISSEYSGRLAAVNYVEVRPRASGAITAIKFEDGALVKEGDELFTIDTRPYEAEVARAKAAVVSAQSEARLAQVELDRAKALLQKDHVSKSLYDQRASSQQVANAKIGSAVSQLKQTQLNLEYAHVKAPISGRIGRAEITIGNVVEAGSSAPVLATILADDKIYAEFDVDEHTYISTMRHLQAGGEKLPVKLTLSGDDHVYHGVLSSFDNQLNPESGTIRARALLENTDGTLIPGMYSKIELQSDSGKKLMAPEAAIGTDQDKKFVFVVDKKNTIEYRPITPGARQDGMRVIISGLQEGEKVVVSGTAMLRPGMPVTPMEASEQK
jgi:multidrug efflux system membrane fusion protein